MNRAVITSDGRTSPWIVEKDGRCPVYAGPGLRSSGPEPRSGSQPYRALVPNALSAEIARVWPEAEAEADLWIARGDALPTGCLALTRQIANAIASTNLIRRK